MRSQEEIEAAVDVESRPFSNHSEFDSWADRYCYSCVHDDAATEKWCPILNAALIGKGWPAEWTRERVPFTSVDGVAMAYERVDTCTEFEERRDDDGDDPEPEPEPLPVVVGQMDLIDAYLDTAISELTEPSREVSDA